MHVYQYNTLKVGNGDGVSILGLFNAGSQTFFLVIIDADSRVFSLLNCTLIYINYIYSSPYRNP